MESIKYLCFVFLFPMHTLCTNCFFRQLSKNLQTTKSNDRCDVDLRKYVEGLRKNENWTVTMYESSFTNIFGCGSQNIYDFGFFDDCVQIYNRTADVQGKYCLASLNLPLLLSDYYTENEQKILRQMDTPKGKWGICIPAACDSAKISSYLSPGILNFNEAHCQTQITKTSHTDILAFTLIGMVLLTCIGSSFIDAVFNNRDKVSGIPRVFSAFSYYTNARLLFRPSPEKSNKVSCLFGIQSLSIFWLTLGHFYLYTFRFPIENIKDAINFVGSNESVWMLKSDLCIDTMFLIAGVMMTITFMNIHEINCRKVVYRYLGHVIRLTSPLLFLLIVHTSILKYVGSGPMWSYAEEYMISGCSRSFWSTIFHLRNFIDANETCVDVSWYLSLNMQIFVLSPLILLPLKKYPKVTLCGIVILMCVCIQMSYYSALKYSLRPFMDVFKSPAHEKRHYHYHVKIIPSLMGILAGYSIHWMRSLNGNFYPNKILLSLLWITSIITMSACILCGHNLLIDGSNRTLDVLYITFLKPVWLISLGWLIFACEAGYGGLLDKCLSLPFFESFANLSYCIYLLHSTLNMTILYTSRYPVTFTHVSMLYNFTCYFVLLLMGSVVWNLSFEMPVGALSKYFAGSNKAISANGFVPDTKTKQ